jgi:hypothetical protein
MILQDHHLLASIARTLPLKGVSRADQGCKLGTTAPRVPTECRVGRGPLSTRFVGGLTPQITDEDIRDHFYAFGEIAGIKKVDAKACAFITFTSRCVREQHGMGLMPGHMPRVCNNSLAAAHLAAVCH